jgi:hypothetical protein
MNTLINFRWKVLGFLLFFALTANAQRDPLLWPFAVNSIWNMPIGDGAIYVPALLQEADNFGMTVDEDIIILKPNAPLQEIYTNYADWDATQDRCIEEGPLLFSAPIPDDFIVSSDNWDGLTPNSGTAFLLPDGETIIQTQPFARCTPSTATSHYVPGESSIYGDGIRGAHGGSGLSAIGGALRLGELDEPMDVIRHALKINVYAAENLFYDEETEGYRWPAIRADGYAENVYGTERTEAVVTACRMGALLALPTFLDLDSLAFETTPGRILAEAFRNYGAYIVDDTAWDVYAIITEWSPDGRFMYEFENAWGFPFKEPNKNTPWTRDIRRIFSNLHVVDNNGPENIGGGGTPLMPLAPPFDITSIVDEQPAEITVYPNPVKDELVLDVEMSQVAGIQIVGVQGQANAVTLLSNRINVSHLPKGIYILQLSLNNGQLYHYKFIKQ